MSQPTSPVFRDGEDRAAVLDDLHDPARRVATAAALLADADVIVREQAARVLIGAGTEEAARHVVPFIASPDIGVRNLAGEVLVQLGAVAVDPVAEAIGDDDYDLRKFAIDVLALLPAEAAADRIAAALQDEDQNVVLAAIDALGVLDHERRYAEPIKRLYAEHPWAQASVVHAVGTFQRPEDVDFLTEALRNEDPSVQLTAAEALSKQSGPAVFEQLLRVVGTVHPLAQPIISASLVDFCTEHPSFVEQVPAETQALALNMLEEYDTTFVRAGMQAVRLFQARQALPRVLSLTGRDDETDLEIFQTLAAFPNPLDALLEAHQQGRLRTDPAAQLAMGLVISGTIGAADHGAVSVFLCTHFSDLDPDTKLEVLDGLMTHGTPTLVTVVQTALWDPAPTVQQHAAQVLLMVAPDATF